MKKSSLFIIIILLMMSIISSAVWAQRKKLAQTGCEFLLVGASGRASAMGEAFTTVEGGAAALFYNPAGIARLPGLFDLTVNVNNWIADIKHNSFSIAVSPWHGEYGVIGISALWVDYGDFLGTVVWNNELGYLDTETFSPKALAIGIGYAKPLTDRFAVGGQIKQVAQSLGKSMVPEEGSNTGLGVKKNIVSVLAFDFGTIYRTGFKSLSFGMSVRNFSKEIKFDQESFELPLSFKMGVSMNVMDFFPNLSNIHSMAVSIDAVHPRAYPEYIAIGGEYLFMKMLALRAGYISGHDEYSATYGFGVQQFGLAIDYAYTPFGVFDSVQRISIRFSR